MESSKCMAHHCRICGRSRPNEQFSGRDHRIHVWKKCQRLPWEQCDRITRLDELHGLHQQSNISAKNIKRLKTLTGHADRLVAKVAASILEIARVLPGKRSRWLKLARRHCPFAEKNMTY